MKERSCAEDFLLTFCWMAEQMMRPSLPILMESFEGWEYRHRLRHYVRGLEQKRLIRREERAGKIVFRLTELGCLTGQGGRDPVARWRRAWDRRWRMLVFDLPRPQQVFRKNFLRWLRQNDFGYLQDSLWVRPDPIGKVAKALEGFKQDVESLTTFEARCLGHKDEAIVRGAWPFQEIRSRYAAYLSLLKRRPRKPAELVYWLGEERLAWLDAISIDPLLPRALLPADYLGERAWEARHHAIETLLNA